MVDGGLWMVNQSVKFEDWRYIASTGSGKGEWIILKLQGNWELELGGWKSGIMEDWVMGRFKTYSVNK